MTGAPSASWAATAKLWEAITNPPRLAELGLEMNYLFKIFNMVNKVGKLTKVMRTQVIYFHFVEVISFNRLKTFFLKKKKKSQLL